MGTKKSVWLADETVEVCNQLTRRSDDSINYSSSLNSAAEQFQLFVEDNLPDLTDAQWRVFYSAFNEHELHSRIKQEAKMLQFTVSESYQHDKQVSDILGSPEEAAKFIQEVGDWTLSQKLAVIYKATAFWRLKLRQEEI